MHGKVFWGKFEVFPLFGYRNILCFHCMLQGRRSIAIYHLSLHVLSDQRTGYVTWHPCWQTSLCRRWRSPLWIWSLRNQLDLPDNSDIFLTSFRFFLDLVKNCRHHIRFLSFWIFLLNWGLLLLLLSQALK
jgi:hypothetical protein